MFSNQTLLCLRGLSFYSSLAISGCSLISALQCRRKFLDTEAERLVPDSFLTVLQLHNCCHKGTLDPVVPEPLTDHEKPKSRFFIKYSNVFKVTTLAKQKTFVAQIWSKDHMFATSKLGRNESVPYLKENTKVQSYSVRG